MSKKITSVIILLLSSVFVLSNSVSVSALNSAVYFEGGADNFVIYPNHDLFDNFKNVYPGDKLTEEIKVRNTAPEYDYVKIYLRAETHDDITNPPINTDDDTASMHDFLRQLSLKVYNGGNLIYSATPDQLDGLSQNQLLGEFVNGASTKLTVQLDVPVALGNKYMHRVGEVDWIFTAEGYIDDKPVCPDCPDHGSNDKPQELPNGPKTGDNLILNLYVLFASILGLATSMTIIKKQA
jgi:hypothetical protein